MAKRQHGESVDYFDFAVRSMKTGYINYGGAMYPVCYFTSPSYYPVTTCDAAPVTLRFSFQRTERVPDYKPMEYGERKMGRFGFFRTEHYTRNRRRGVTESGRIYLANIHSIWEKYHVRCASGDEGDAGCSDGAGGFAEVSTNFSRIEDQGVTIGYERVEIPVAQRTPKPLVYRLSPYFPQPLDGSSVQRLRFLEQRVPARRCRCMGLQQYLRGYGRRQACSSHVCYV